MLNAPWQHYSTPEVRALAWARLSRSLVNTLPESLSASQQSDLSFFQQLDRDPTPLQHHLAHCPRSQSHRLGLYFESLWQFYLSHHPEYRLIKHDLQIFDKQHRTLGAFDFIYQYLPDNSYHHLEVAVKFYLFAGGTSGNTEDMQLWPGPNPKDTLGNKVDRLKDHQLCLADRAEGNAALQELDALPLQSRSAQIKGCLFLPWRKQFSLPTWASNNHQICHWLPVEDLPALLKMKSGSRWMILNKKRWLGDVLLKSSDTVLAGSDFNREVSDKMQHFPLMVARFNSSNIEVERFFVVPEEWRDDVQNKFKVYPKALD